LSQASDKALLKEKVWERKKQQQANNKKRIIKITVHKRNVKRNIYKASHSQLTLVYNLWHT